MQQHAPKAASTQRWGGDQHTQGQCWALVAFAAVPGTASLGLLSPDVSSKVFARGDGLKCCLPGPIHEALSWGFHLKNKYHFQADGFFLLSNFPLTVPGSTSH